jgi:tyrosine-protein kinase Etk/Wzc
MRKGKLDKHLCCSGDQGLSGYLSGQAALSSIVLKTDLDGLDFIPKGIVPPNPSEILMHSRLAQLFATLENQYDLIIVDTPPLLAVTDAAIIGAYAGTTMLVTRFNETTLKELEITAQRFEQNGVLVKGVILNGIKKEAGSAYSEYGYYQYEYSN